MRRKDREVKDFNVIRQIIDECEIIRIGLCDGDMFPYIVPMNFAYVIEGEQIYFYLHGAMAGRKYELMRKNGVCSFEMDCGHQMELIPKAKDVTMRYKSVMGKAKIEFLEGEDKFKGLDIIMNRDERTRNFEYNRAVVPRTAVIKLTVTEYSGKANPVGGNAD
ncbi:MAG: pyridoxamine 5'-phosphate oxidase family protein [Clostridia bacterium]|nr:pyridoxamine 5'-phosphate oxidase family protein [Clostridia bacterium]